MIQEFWIIDSNGIALFHQSVERNIDESTEPECVTDEQLFGGLLSAILSMYSEMSASQIQKMEGNEGKFLFFSNYGLIFVVRAKLNISDKKIKKKIQIIQEKFINKYKKELEAFDGNVQSFQLFKKELEDTFNQISKTEKWGKGLINL